jgi:hypothetical protein
MQGTGEFSHYAYASKVRLKAFSSSSGDQRRRPLFTRCHPWQALKDVPAGREGCVSGGFASIPDPERLNHRSVFARVQANATCIPQIVIRSGAPLVGPGSSPNMQGTVGTYQAYESWKRASDSAFDIPDTVSSSENGGLILFLRPS